MPANSDLVDAVVAAFRAEGMKGSRAQMERFARAAVEALRPTGEDHETGIELWRCAEGHWSTDPQPEAGHGDGPPFHCPYPCLERVEGPFAAYLSRVAVETCDRDTVRLRELLAGLAEAARWFSTEADYTVAEVIEAEFAEALEMAEAALALAEFGERDG